PPARLERAGTAREALRQALIEEEDVTITILLDGSASMAGGTPDKLQFAKRAAAALGYIGLASEDKVAISVLGGKMARRRTALRGSGRVFRLLADLPPTAPAKGGTGLVAAARHAAAQRTRPGVARVAASRHASYVDLASDVPLNELIFAELRRRRVLG